MKPASLNRGDVCEAISRVARKADLLAYAIEGLMANQDDEEEAWPMFEQAYTIKADLNALAKEAGKR